MPRRGDAVHYGDRGVPYSSENQVEQQGVISCEASAEPDTGFENFDEVLLCQRRDAKWNRQGEDSGALLHNTRSHAVHDKALLSWLHSLLTV
jgi:hypothetical protein